MLGVWRHVVPADDLMSEIRGPHGIASFLAKTKPEHRGE